MARIQKKFPVDKAAFRGAIAAKSFSEELFIYMVSDYPHYSTSNQNLARIFFLFL